MSSYYRRLDAERGAGHLTACFHDVLRALAILVDSGFIAPSNADLAAKAGCSESTARRAKARARQRGLLITEACFVLVDGRRQQRASNHSLQVPTTPLGMRPRRSRWRSFRGGQSDRPSKSVLRTEREDALEDCLRQCAAYPDRMADRQIVAFEARLRACWRPG